MVKLNDPGEENGTKNQPSIPVTRFEHSIQVNLSFGSMERPLYLCQG